MRGVVHVGAHKGEEVAQYLAEGRSPIICFEPQSLGWKKPEGVLLVPMALSDRSGLMDLKVPQHLNGEPDTMSATGLFLDCEAARSIGWTPTKCHALQIPAVRFDDWSGRNLAWQCSLLVIDVQGMELQVLIGIGQYLSYFVEAIIECSSPAVYEGGADANEVVDYMNEFGFDVTTPIVPHGDIHFRRRA